MRKFQFHVPTRLALVLAVVGPGIITANADNDATGILGYSLAGAAYQYRMLWVLLISTVSLGIAQEICARMGAITGKGLADLIREEYGIKVTVFAMVTLLVANFATTVAEFAGILAALRVLAPPYLYDVVRFVALPVVASGIWLMVVRGSYRGVERALLFASFIYLSYVVSAFLVHPPWGQVLKQTVAPEMKGAGSLRDYVFMVINVVGTTITPWGQFYVQSAIRDKGIRPEDYPLTRIDVFFGAFFTNLIAYFIIVACGATLYVAGIHQLSDAGQAALALRPIAGAFASVLFAVGLLNASCFGAIILPLSTAYAVTEALGTESGVGRRVQEAPLFIGIYTLLIVVGALVVILFPTHLTALMILPNIVGGVLLPVILVLMQLLANKPHLMGEHTNGRAFNIAAWVSTGVLTALSLLLLITQL